MATRIKCLKHNITYTVDEAIKKQKTDISIITDIYRKVQTENGITLKQNGATEEKTSKTDIKLTDDKYENFRMEMLRIGVPNYVQKSSLNKKNNRIHIGVILGSLAKADQFLKTNFSNLNDCQAFEVTEQGKLSFAPFAANADDSEYSDPQEIIELNTVADVPGQEFEHVKHGLQITACQSHIVHNKEKMNHGEVKVQIYKMYKDLFGGTIGAILQDTVSKICYATTAKHVLNKNIGYDENHSTDILCTMKKSNGGEKALYLLGDTYFGHLGSYERDGCKEGTDFAVIPISGDLNDRIDAQFKNKSGKLVEMNIFRKSSQSLIGLNVQTIGARTGFLVSEVVDVNQDIYLDNIALRDCFVVAYKEGETFAQCGDSGSMIIDVMCEDTLIANGYGVISIVQEGYETNSKNYKNVAICVRLDKALNYIKSKNDLSLTFVHPDNLYNDESNPQFKEQKKNERSRRETELPDKCREEPQNVKKQSHGLDQLQSFILSNNFNRNQ